MTRTLPGPAGSRKGPATSLFAFELILLVLGFFTAFGLGVVFYNDGNWFFSVIAGFLPSPFNQVQVFAYVVGTGIFWLVSNLLILSVMRRRRAVGRKS